MILTIVFLMLFFIAAGLLTLFVFSVFIPAIKQSDDEMESYVFAPDELRPQENKKVKLADTGLRAVVKCSHSKEFSFKRLEYDGPKDCRLFNGIFQSEFDCLYQCIGFGSCVEQCPQQAITIVNNTAVVLAGCIGCGRCVSVCPKGVIELLPFQTVDRAIPCCAEDDDTSCTAYKKQEKNTVPERKIFKFWRICYNILYGKDE